MEAGPSTLVSEVDHFIFHHPDPVVNGSRNGLHMPTLAAACAEAMYYPEPGWQVVRRRVLVVDTPMDCDLWAASQPQRQKRPMYHDHCGGGFFPETKRRGTPKRFSHP